MSSDTLYAAAVHYRSPKVIGRDVLHTRLLFGLCPDGLGVETIVKARVLTDDPWAEDIMIAYSSGRAFLRQVLPLFESAADAEGEGSDDGE